MMKARPLLRFDGFYICKLLYKRQGLSDRSWNHPVFEVISYKYLRFFPDGKMLSLYTNTAPKRFLLKIK
jgi:F-box protein 9